MRRLGAALVSLWLLSGCASTSGDLSASRSRSVFERPWLWTDEQGTEVTLSRWQGVPLILTVIFTSCTTRCPLTVEKLRAFDEALRRQGRTGAFVLVTLDPVADDPARLRRFKESRHLPPSWHLLRGRLEDTRDLGRLLGVRAIYDDGHIDHDVRIAIFDVRGRLVRDFADWDFDVNAAAAFP